MRKAQAKRFSMYLESFRIDATERVLLSGKGSVPLPPKSFDLLLFLVENSGHILDKEELMKQVWPDSFVEENNLAQNISTLREALGATMRSSARQCRSAVIASSPTSGKPVIRK